MEEDDRAPQPADAGRLEEGFPAESVGKSRARLKSAGGGCDSAAAAADDAAAAAVDAAAAAAAKGFVPGAASSVCDRGVLEPPPLPREATETRLGLDKMRG
jgi:hypothetical protein